VSPAGKSVVIHGPADISTQDTEAIVNAANSSLMGGGGVDGAIHRAGGPAILEECKRYVSKHGRLAAGQAMLTGGGQLKAKYVIHTVGPVFRRDDVQQEELLASCHRESIRLADQHNIHSLAFPAISTGAYGYPVNEASQIAVRAVLDELENSSRVELVRFVLFDISALKAYVKATERAMHDRTGYRLDRFVLPDAEVG
jgi:O-acetyl-ADP-ribose deacetylase (regulator of RNase III)